MAEEEKLVEAMARALCIRNGDCMIKYGCPHSPCTMWEVFTDDARAALAAAREAGYAVVPAGACGADVGTSSQTLPLESLGKLADAF